MKRKGQTEVTSEEPHSGDEDTRAADAENDGDVPAVTRRLLAIARRLITNFEQRLDEDTDGKVLPTIADLGRLYQLVEELGKKMPPPVLEVRWIKTVVNPSSPD